jgi:hypothetical protein
MIYPFGAFPPHPWMSMGPYGMMSPASGPQHFVPEFMNHKNHFQQASTSNQGPRSSSPPPIEGGLDEYFQKCGFDEDTKQKLVDLGFEPGDNLSQIPENVYKEAGFKYLEWQRVVRKDQKFRDEMKRKRHM